MRSDDGSNLVTCHPPAVPKRAEAGHLSSSRFRLLRRFLGFRFVRRYEPRAACVEVRRDLLVDGFVPFVENRVSPAKVARVVAPLARALSGADSSASQRTGEPLWDLLRRRRV